jgi:hypothetical protein
MTTAPFRGLLVPASELQRPTIVPVSADLAELERYVHGLPEQARFSYDSVLFVNGMGHSMQMARNQRVTDWVHRESDAAKRGTFKGVSQDEYSLAGPVVILGERGSGPTAEFTDVPERYLATFGVERAKGAEQG